MAVALWTAPAWLLNVEALELVVAALFLLTPWDLDLGLVPCPEFGLIDAVAPSLIKLFG